MVVLLGVPSQGGGTPFVIGRTGGLSDAIMKIKLEPGWTFAKRTYQGKTLGHIYLAKSGGLSIDSANRNRASRKQASQERPRKVAARPSGQPLFRRSPRRLPEPQLNRPEKVAKVRKQKRYRLYANPRNGSQVSLIKRLAPGAFRTNYRGRSVMQAGLFQDPDKAKELERILRRNRIRTKIVSERGAVPAPRPIFSAPPAASGSILRVPSGRIPLGNARGSGSVFSSSAPPPPPNSRIAFAPRYKVLVPTRSATDQRRIRALVSDAFRASYRGRPAMQVGSFASQAEAESVIQLMRANGFQPMVEKSL